MAPSNFHGVIAPLTKRLWLAQPHKAYGHAVASAAAAAAAAVDGSDDDDTATAADEGACSLEL